MIELRETLEEHLQASALVYPRFQAIVARLYERGVVCRGDSQVEMNAYDDALRIERLLTDYFWLAGCRIVFDHEHAYIRLYPPRASIPGEDDEPSQLAAGMRIRLSANVIAAALVLRFLYSDAVQGGKLDDDGEAETTMEAVATAMQTRLKRDFPEGLGERGDVFKTLRELKLVRYAKDESFDSPSSMIFIRPMITGFVHEEALDAVLLDGVTVANGDAVDDDESESPAEEN